uniref:Uncharacterized protein n=1 Tax=Vespula pensylvanica TaxID=30213 RepID=A0A834N1K8_VESPE|nr:hypothetical protein H0235_017464 [Vespula pensylvanica]
MYNRHVTYFTTISGAPIDIGGKKLVNNNKPIYFRNHTRENENHEKEWTIFYSITRQGRMSVSTQLIILDEALHSFLNATLELRLKTMAIFREPVGDVSWVNVKFKFRLIFSGSQTKILILKNEMIIPKEIERIQIIHDNRSTQWADT